jgi:hypothetical protein
MKYIILTLYFIVAGCSSAPNMADLNPNRVCIIGGNVYYVTIQNGIINYIYKGKENENN